MLIMYDLMSDRMQVSTLSLKNITMGLTFHYQILFRFKEGDTSLTIVQLRLFRLSKKVHMNKDAKFNWSFIDALSKE